MIITKQSFCGFLTWMAVCSRFYMPFALPIKDSCRDVGPEIPHFHNQGELVVIRFPFLEDAIRHRRLLTDNSTFHISHSKLHAHHNDRVIQRGWALWLLPSHPSDSGTYSYVLSSDMFCFTGSISVIIYETGREDLDMMSYPVSAQTDTDLTISCPHIKHFKMAGSPQWYKGFNVEGFPLISARYKREKGDLLTITNISAEDEGLYTSPVTNIPASGGEHPTISTAAASMSPDMLLNITTPINGSIIESHLGSSLVIHCKVLVGTQSHDHTEVTWLVNGQSVDRSYMSQRAFQADRRVLRSHVEVDLVFLQVHEEDTHAELKCVAQNSSGKQEVITHITLEDSITTWLVVAAVSSGFFLLVVSVFLYQLCPKTHRRKDYVLARQSNS
ncbi:interleukin-1 receptor type 2-like isoform X2 [Brachyhypopomus gauderio]|uniref:interleukin-1 receptor type 2-like isoform X2 n=1 Tax=Brachyhypopomus gauderio TaxID=698409 RepID=UPI0040421218